jgi:DNA-binding NarL/FixJ family response regulator
VILPYSLILADGHLRFRDALGKLLKEMPRVRVTGEAATSHDLFQLLTKAPAHLVILDASLPGLRDRGGVRRLRSQYPDTRVLLLVMDQAREYLSHGLAAGVSGVLTKQHVGRQIFRAIDLILRGRTYVPPMAGENNLLRRYSENTTGGLPIR